jgi:hypothetical protein
MSGLASKISSMDGDTRDVDSAIAASAIFLARSVIDCFSFSGIRPFLFSQRATAPNSILLHFRPRIRAVEMLIMPARIGHSRQDERFAFFRDPDRYSDFLFSAVWQLAHAVGYRSACQWVPGAWLGSCLSSNRR